MNALRLAATLTLVGLAGCNGKLPQSINFVATPAPNANPGQGLSLGVTTSLPISDVAVAGAAIQRPMMGHHEVFFAAFVTASPADNADGHNHPLDSTIPPPADTNAEQDVFLAAFVSSATDGAFEARLFGVTQNDRCTTCHGQDYVHAGPDPMVNYSSHPDHHVGEGCTTSNCHESGLTGVSDSFPSSGLHGWHSPPADTPHNFDFRHRMPEELCTSIVSRILEDSDAAHIRQAVHDHFITDPFIIWARTNAREPRVDNPQQLAKVDIDDAAFATMVNAWLDGWQEMDATLSDSAKYNCLASKANKGILLVSRKFDGTASGDAGAHRPALTYKPNDLFDPDNPGAAPAGYVYVAFDSQADDLVANDTNALSDVFRTTIEVHVDTAFLMGAPTEGHVDLVYVPNSNVRVSVRDGTDVQGTGHATSAAIGANGDRIAFVSEDTQLFDLNHDANFANDDVNGKTDVYVREISTHRTRLVSLNALGTAAGDGDSSGPVMSVGSDRAVAFVSSASNLVPNDVNDVQDVFWVLLESGPLDLDGFAHRASVKTGGAQAHGGDSDHPALFVVDADVNDVLVAFDSAATDLTPEHSPNSTRGVYLHESLGAGRTTFMVQKRLPLLTIGSAAGGTMPADSLHPVISADGSTLIFDSLADNIDFVRPIDDNHAVDVFAVDLTEFLGTGRIKPQRLSVTSNGQSANAGSSRPRVAGFRMEGAAAPAFLGRPTLFDTLATDIAHAGDNPTVLVFLPAIVGH